MKFLRNSGGIGVRSKSEPKAEFATYRLSWYLISSLKSLDSPHFLPSQLTYTQPLFQTNPAPASLMLIEIRLEMHEVSLDKKRTIFMVISNQLFDGTYSYSDFYSPINIASFSTTIKQPLTNRLCIKRLDGTVIFVRVD